MRITGHQTYQANDVLVDVCQIILTITLVNIYVLNAFCYSKLLFYEFWSYTQEYMGHETLEQNMIAEKLHRIIPMIGSFKCFFFFKVSE